MKTYTVEEWISGIKATLDRFKEWLLDNDYSEINMTEDDWSRLYSEFIELKAGVEPEGMPEDEDVLLSEHHIKLREQFVWVTQFRITSSKLLEVPAGNCRVFEVSYFDDDTDGEAKLIMQVANVYRELFNTGAYEEYLRKALRDVLKGAESWEEGLWDDLVTNEDSI